MVHLLLGIVLVGITQVWCDEAVLPCVSAPDCVAIEGAVCDDNRCTCPAGTVMSGNMAKCLTVSSGYGDACEESAQCAVRMLTGGTCAVDTNTCACVTGHHYLHGRCWRSVDLGGACSDSAQCYGNYNYESLSCATSGVCECSAGFYLHEGDSYCRRIGEKEGDECIFDFDCKFDGGKCLADKCQASSFKEDTSKELLADGMIYDVDSEMLIAYKTAVRDSRLGEVCVTNEDCQTTDANAECSSGKTCWCSKGHYNMNGACVKELGERCAADSECQHVPFALCRANVGSAESTCSCTVQYTASLSNQLCIKLKPSVPFNCQGQLESCQNFGPLCECMVTGSKMCECRANSHFENTPKQCWPDKGFGETCNDGRDCVTASGTAGVDCIAGSCQCLPSYHNTDGDCRPDGLVIGAVCQSDEDCMFSHAACSASKRCTCAAGYFRLQDDAGVTTCATGLGGECKDDADCGKVEQSRCAASGVCECSSDTLVANAAHNRCLQVAEKIEDDCVESVQCESFGNSSACVDDKCICLENYHFRDQACWPIRNLNDKCTSQSECYLMSDSDRTECRNGFCECKYDFPESSNNKDCNNSAVPLNSRLWQTIVALLAVTSSLISLRH